MENKESLAEFVKRHRHQKNLSLKDVQRRSKGKITDGYISRIENGVYTNPSPVKLKALATGLGVTEDDIFAIVRGYKPKEPDGIKEQYLLDFVTDALDLLRQRIGNEEFFNFLTVQMTQYTQRRDDAMKEEESPQRERKRA
jgi:transcriptional regulator with XRE-family HTH domain